MHLHALPFVLLFLPIVVAAHALVAKRGSVMHRKALLVAASLAFYVLAGPSALPVLLASLLMNHLVARRLVPGGANANRKRWLVGGIVANLVLLGAFKYTHFAAENVAALTGWSVQLPRFALPLGVSFFTIQQIMYLVDCYEEMVQPAPLLEHALFISFFPYVTAGPIVRAADTLESVEKDGPSHERMSAGLVLFVLGLSKKVILADAFGQYADGGFGAAGALGAAEAWIAALAYTFQLYFDFSGYSDMAIGVGLLLGVTLPQNFDTPLAARSVIDFWRRWHITLSNFITTYLYTPIARSVRPLKFHIAMGITLLSMAIAGLWHGAAWTFVLFGVLHGAGLVTNQVWKKKVKLPVPGPLAWLLTFLFVVAAFVVFRATDLGHARSMFGAMLGANGLRGQGASAFGGISRLEQLQFAPTVLFGAAAAVLGPNSNEIVKSFRPSAAKAIGVAATLVLCLAYMNGSAMKGFIYRGF